MQENKFLAKRQQTYRIRLVVADSDRIVVVEPPIPAEYKDQRFRNIVNNLAQLGVSAALVKSNKGKDTQIIVKFDDPYITSERRDEIFEGFGNNMFKFLINQGLVVYYNAKIKKLKYNETAIKQKVSGLLENYKNKGSKGAACVSVGMPQLLTPEGAIQDPYNKTHGLNKPVVDKIARRICGACAISNTCEQRRN